MTCHTRLPILAATLAAGLCLMPTASNKAVAQITFSVGRNTPSYYNGYSPRYTRGYVNGQGMHGYNAYGNGPYGYGAVGPYGYGVASPYGYGVATPYRYPSTPGYGYRSGTSSNLYYRGLQFQGGAYRPVYRANTTRYYSPYGIGYRSF